MLSLTIFAFVVTFGAEQYPPEQIHIALGQTPDTIAFTCMYTFAFIIDTAHYP